MSKTITSPVKRYPGTVTLSDPLTYPQVIAFDTAMDRASELGDVVLQSQFNGVMEPAVMACVEAWDISGLPPKPQHMPASPRKSAHAFFDWIFREILALYQEAEEIPNA